MTTAMRRRRVMVLGLDCADPRQSFDRLAAACPHLTALRAHAVHGALHSTVPPITVPAWATMASGASPGALGLYGFRNRVPGTYDLRVASAADVRRPRVWDVLSDVGRRSVLLGVPPTYPTPRAPGVTVVSCFLTPSADSEWASPPALRPELERLVGEYRMDVLGFRSPDRARVLAELYAMVDQHFTMAGHLLDRDPDWDLFWMVEMGLDRFHHAFWSTWNPDHARHDPADPLAGEAARFYAFVDERLGTLLARAGEDTAVLVVSDHGARTLRGGVAVNELLSSAGLLTLRRPLTGTTRLEDAGVDWDHTVAWAEGGYYARVFLNVKGREPRGTVAPHAVPRILDELERLFLGVAAPDGAPMSTRVRRPADVYADVTGAPPDLMVFWDDLARRAVGTVGHGTDHVPDNDTGPDGCNHDWRGLYALSVPWQTSAGSGPERPIAGIGAAILDLLSVPDGARPAELRPVELGPVELGKRT
jgi:predicted AlkP superfamily phosphohydrolase/phosphomutase